MANRYSARSLSVLKELDPRLAAIMEGVLGFWDHSLVDGLRDEIEQARNLRLGVSKTKNSRHFARNKAGELDPKGKAHAVDAVPFPSDWSAIEKGLNALKKADPGLQTAEFYGFLGFVQGFAAAKGVNLRLGADWDSDREFSDHSFIDLGHIELDL